MKNVITLLTCLLLAAAPVFAQTTKPSSDPATVAKSITPIPNSAIPTPHSTYAVVVGISDYQDPGIPDLRFADKDAEAFANFLRSPAGGALDNDHLSVLTNQNATAGRVAEAMDWLLEQTKADDEVIIYFSGHGDVERKTVSQPGFLLCWDSPARVYMGGGTYSLAYLQEIVTTLSTQNKAKVVVITDACHAGKLAGSQIGGAQATTANLARQFANEVKILSCQPNEFSLEGEQWGGGRGCFSYHLVDALFGLADRNGDAFVSLGELDRYLEDHVTGEAAPQSQVPMLLGNKTERISVVNEQMLAVLKKNKAGGMPIFMATEGRGFEDEILARVDSSIREMYWAFKHSIQEKRFFEPQGNCADEYYAQLIQIDGLTPLFGFMKRNYAAALQDDAQQAINKLVNLDKTEVRLYRLERLKKYSPYPRLLERAADLLGEAHYMYSSLQARKYYFEGEVLRMENALNPDSVLGERLLQKYRQSLAWEQDAAITHIALVEVFKTVVPNRDSAIMHLDAAIAAAPTWTRAYRMKANCLIEWRKFEEAREYLNQALAIDSTQERTWQMIGTWNFFQGNLDASEPYFLKSIALDSTYETAYYWLGIFYFEKGKMNEAIRVFLKATQAERPNQWVFDYLGSAHYNIGQYVEAEKYYKKALEIEPNDGLCLIHLAGTYLKTQRVGEAKAMINTALVYDSSIQMKVSIAEVFSDNRLYTEAENILKKCIAQDSLSDISWAYLGYNYLKSERFAEAEHAYKKAISLASRNFWNISGLGQVYVKTGRYKEAQDCFYTLLKMDQNSPNGYIHLAILSAVEGKTNEALDFAEQAFQKGMEYGQIFEYPYYDFAPVRAVPGFRELLKKYFPDQVKD